MQKNTCFEPSNLCSDIAVVTLDNIPTKHRLQRLGAYPIEIRWGTTGVSYGTRVFGLGHGPTSVDPFAKPSERLQNASSLSTDFCSAIRFPTVDSETSVCAIGSNRQSICKGDSGGPLVVYEMDHRERYVPKLLGLLSAVTSLEANCSCRAGAPVLAVKIASFKEWIEDCVGEYRLW